MSARLRFGGAHLAPRPRRSYDQRMDLGHRIAILLAVVYLAVVALPPIALVWVAAFVTVGVMLVLLLGRVLQLGRPLPEQEGRHRG